ncbi:extracellular catalytic domain type 1 short-chain-length polyhydroxyalkanoate depolymerase [Algivirga pacifica]
MNIKEYVVVFSILMWVIGCQPQESKEEPTVDVALTTVEAFGTNPGALEMYYYQPKEIKTEAPIVVALHGCTQTAADYAVQSGWNTMADRYGFYVVYPQQKTDNNAYACFNWFEEGDIAREGGEAQSIREMVAYMADKFQVNEDKIFVTGFSAGGAMTSVMLATYPEVFKGGAVNAGIPYKAGIGMLAGMGAMKDPGSLSPQQRAEKVREASSYEGEWPTLTVFHGAQDDAVNVLNANELVKQFIGLHTKEEIPLTEWAKTDKDFEGVKGLTRVSYPIEEQEAVVYYEFEALGHALPVDPGTEKHQGGQEATYAKDVDFSSSYWALKEWEIIPETLEAKSK